MFGWTFQKFSTSNGKAIFSHSFHHSCDGAMVVQEDNNWKWKFCANGMVISMILTSWNTSKGCLFKGNFQKICAFPLHFNQFGLHFGSCNEKFHEFANCCKLFNIALNLRGGKVRSGDKIFKITV